jgi:hypothetical protein
MSADDIWIASSCIRLRTCRVSGIVGDAVAVVTDTFSIMATLTIQIRCAH